MGTLGSSVVLLVPICLLFLLWRSALWARHKPQAVGTVQTPRQSSKIKYRCIIAATKKKPSKAKIVYDRNDKLLFNGLDFRVSQTINDLHLHAKLGDGLPESVPLTDFLDVVDEEMGQLVVMKLMPKEQSLYKATYGPIENVVLPGVKLPRPVNLTNIRITGLTGLQLNYFRMHTNSNRLMCKATIPSLVVDVTFDNLQMELDENFGDQEFYTSIRLSVRLLDLEILASARYEIKGMSTNEYMFIDEAEVDINAREAVFELNLVRGLEEVRYVLSELLNNSLEDIMDAVLKVVVQEINKELVKMDPEANFLLVYLKLLKIIPYIPYTYSYTPSSS